MSALEELAHHLPGEEGRYTTKNKTFDMIASYLDRQERVCFLTHVWGVSAQAKASSALYGSGTNSATVLGMIATGKPQSSLPGNTVIEATGQILHQASDIKELRFTFRSKDGCTLQWKLSWCSENPLRSFAGIQLNVCKEKSIATAFSPELAGVENASGYRRVVNAKMVGEYAAILQELRDDWKLDGVNLMGKAPNELRHGLRVYVSVQTTAPMQPSRNGDGRAIDHAADMFLRSQTCKTHFSLVCSMQLHPTLPQSRLI
jgi:hypothetical protein